MITNAASSPQPEPIQAGGRVNKTSTSGMKKKSKSPSQRVRFTSEEGLGTDE
jgi:hypothetical protein